MVDERLEAALAWCEKNKLESSRLKKFNRESKRKEKQSNKKRRKFLSEKVNKRIQS